MNRRSFLVVGGALAGAALLGSRAFGQSRRPRLRTVTYNVRACQGFQPRGGNRELLDRAGPQMLQRFALELGLYDPDIITLQEAPSPEEVATIAKAMGRNHVWFPGGGAVITRFQIVEAENCPLVGGPKPDGLFTRHWGRALLETGGQRLALYSAHLHPSDKGVRAREVSAVLEVMTKSIADTAPMLFQGDLNHEPNGPEYERLREAHLVDTFAQAGSGPAFTFRSTRPNRRIDYIWANASLARRLRASRMLYDGAFRTIPEDARSYALSDHLPVMSDFWE